MKRVRSSSMDLRSDFKAFTSALDHSSERLKTIVYMLDQTCEKTRQRRDGLPQKATVAAGTAGVGVGGGTIMGIMALAPLTGGMSLVVAGIAAGAAAAGAAVASLFHVEKISDEGTVKEVEKLFREFLEDVGSLRPILEDLKTSLKNLDRDTEDVVRTQTRIQDLYALLQDFTEEATVERLLQVKEQCSRTLHELLKLREAKWGQAS